MNIYISTIKRLFILFAFVFCTMASFCQTIHYSRQNFRLPYYDGIQLVSNVSGNHHVLAFTLNEHPSIHVFDRRLQLLGNKQVQFTLRKDHDVVVIPFPNFYYLYIHQHGSAKHELWKVTADGEASSFSNFFHSFLESTLGNNTATLQLINNNNRLFVVANTYFDEIKKIATTVLLLDKNLNLLSTRRVLFPFDSNEDQLNQVMMAGEDMLLLKTSNDSIGNALKILKANLNTGKLWMNSFSSGAYGHASPACVFDASDSSILIYSMVQKAIFINKLDSKLDPKLPVTLIRKQFNANVTANFVLVKGVAPQWIGMNLSSNRPRWNVRTSPYQTTDENLLMQRGESFDEFSARNSSSDPSTVNYDAYKGQGLAIRFSLLNNKFQVLKDSVVKNDKNFYTLESGPFAKVSIRNKPYLFLSQFFSSKKRGILMVKEGEGDQIATSDVRVYEHYQYFLPQLQVVNDEAVIIPFLHKRELGLVKIMIDK